MSERRCAEVTHRHRRHLANILAGAELSLSTVDPAMLGLSPDGPAVHFELADLGEPDWPGFSRIPLGRPLIGLDSLYWPDVEWRWPELAHEVPVYGWVLLVKGEVISAQTFNLIKVETYSGRRLWISEPRIARGGQDVFRVERPEYRLMAGA